MTATVDLAEVVRRVDQDPRVAAFWAERLH